MKFLCLQRAGWAHAIFWEGSERFFKGLKFCQSLLAPRSTTDTALILVTLWKVRRHLQGKPRQQCGNVTAEILCWEVIWKETRGGKKKIHKLLQISFQWLEYSDHYQIQWKKIFSEVGFVLHIKLCLEPVWYSPRTVMWSRWLQRLVRKYYSSHCPTPGRHNGRGKPDVILYVHTILPLIYFNSSASSRSPAEWSPAKSPAILQYHLSCLLGLSVILLGVFLYYCLYSEGRGHASRGFGKQGRGARAQLRRGCPAPRQPIAAPSSWELLSPNAIIPPASTRSASFSFFPQLSRSQTVSESENELQEVHKENTTENLPL